MPHIVVVARALWTTREQIKAVTMPTRATQYALAGWTVGEGSPVQRDREHKCYDFCLE